MQHMHPLSVILQSDSPFRSHTLKTTKDNARSYTTRGLGRQGMGPHFGVNSEQDKPSLLVYMGRYSLSSYTQFAE